MKNLLFLLISNSIVVSQCYASAITACKPRSLGYFEQWTTKEDRKHGLSSRHAQDYLERNAKSYPLRSIRLLEDSHLPVRFVDLYEDPTSLPSDHLKNGTFFRLLPKHDDDQICKEIAIIGRSPRAFSNTGALNDDSRLDVWYNYEWTLCKKTSENICVPINVSKNASRRNRVKINLSWHDTKDGNALDLRRANKVCDSMVNVLTNNIYSYASNKLRFEKRQSARLKLQIIMNHMSYVDKHSTDYTMNDNSHRMCVAKLSYLVDIFQEAVSKKENFKACDAEILNISRCMVREVEMADDDIATARTNILVPLQTAATLLAFFPPTSFAGTPLAAGLGLIESLQSREDAMTGMSRAKFLVTSTGFIQKINWADKKLTQMQIDDFNEEHKSLVEAQFSIASSVVPKVPLGKLIKYTGKGILKYEIIRNFSQLTKEARDVLDEKMYKIISEIGKDVGFTKLAPKIQEFIVSKFQTKAAVGLLRDEVVELVTTFAKQGVLEFDGEGLNLNDFNAKQNEYLNSLLQESERMCQGS